MPAPSRHAAIALAAAILAGCQTVGPATRKPFASVAPTATAAPSAKPVASTAPLQLLRRPDGAVTELSGTVGMDAGYVVAAGQGGIVSNNSGSVLALNGGGIVSNNGGGLISDHGAGIISDHGAGVLADGNEIAGFQLLADASPHGLLPTAGALVHVTSLATGQPLTLGVDTQGKAVTSVYSNSRGAFKVFLPASEAGNVLVQVSAPTGSDERLKQALLADPKAAATVDDDTALATRFVRTVLTARMVTILAEPGATAFDAILAGSANTQNPAVKEVLRGLVQDLNGAARQHGVPTDPNDPKVQALAARLIDIVMASVGSPDQILITKLLAPDWPAGDTPALAALGQAMKDMRLGAQAKLDADPSFFKTHDFAFRDGQEHDYTAKIEVIKATDPGTYCVVHFFTKNEDNGFRNFDYVMRDLDVRYGQDGISHADRIEAATYALLGAITGALQADGPAHAPVLAAIESTARAQGWQP